MHRVFATCRRSVNMEKNVLHIKMDRETTIYFIYDRSFFEVNSVYIFLAALLTVWTLGE